MTKSHWAIFFALLIVTATLALGLARIEVDNGLRAWFVDDDPALEPYEAFLADFGNDEVVVTAHRFLAAPTAADIDALRARMEDARAIDGVARVREVALEGKTIVTMTWLASDDGGRTLDAARPQILADLRRAFSHGDLEVHHVGMGVLYDATNAATLGEGSLFIGLSYLVMVLLLIGLTRSWRWTFMAVLVVSLSDMALFGVMGLVGQPVTMFLMALPALVMILALAHVVHLFVHLQARDAHARSPRAVLRVLVVPCALNTATAAAGFFSLELASVDITRTFGRSAALGAIFAFFLAVGIAFLWCPRTRRDGPGRGGRLVVTLAERAMFRLRGRGHRHRRPCASWQTPTRWVFSPTITLFAPRAPSSKTRSALTCLWSWSSRPDPGLSSMTSRPRSAPSNVNPSLAAPNRSSTVRGIRPDW